MVAPQFGQNAPEDQVRPVAPDALQKGRRKPPHRTVAEPRSVAFVVRLKPSERDRLAEVAREAGVSLADLTRRRLLEMEIPRPKVRLADAEHYATLHRLSVALRNTVSILNGLATAHHKGFQIEADELRQSALAVRAVVKEVALQFLPPDEGGEG